MRSEVARGAASFPANIHHRNLEPMASASLRSARSMQHRQLLHELEYRRGAEEAASPRCTMGGHRHGSFHWRRSSRDSKAIIDASPVPVGTVPVYEAISRVRRSGGLTFELMREVIEEQAEQGVDSCDTRGRTARACAAGAQADYGIVSRGGSLMAHWMEAP